jgi:hypothetical protein
MSKIRTFFYSLFNSVTNPGYYKDILKVPSSFSWQFFAMFNFLLGLVVIAQILVPVSRLDVRGLSDQLIAQYPSDLDIRLDEDGLSINKPLPYALQLPHEMTEEMDEAEYSNFIVFASDSDITRPGDVLEYEAPIVLTESTAYMIREPRGGRIETYVYPEMKETVELNKQVIRQGQEIVLEMPFIKHKLYLGLIGLSLLCLIPFIWVFKALVTVMYAFLATLAAKLFFAKKQLSFGNVLQMSLHSMSLIVIIAFVLDLLPIHFKLHGMSYFLAYLVWMGVIIAQLPDRNGAVSAAAHSAKAKTSSRAKKRA